MSWPPIVGDRLPRAAEAFGITEKLVTYSLNIDHPDGGPKARGFEQTLGITLADVDHLAKTLRREVLDAVITNVRDNAPFGFVVESACRSPDSGSEAIASSSSRPLGI